MDVVAVSLEGGALVGCLALGALALVAAVVFGWKVLESEAEKSQITRNAITGLSASLATENDPNVRAAIAANVSGSIDDVVSVLKTLPPKMRFAGLLVIAALIFAFGGLIGAGLVEISLTPDDTTTTTTTTTTTG